MIFSVTQKQKLDDFMEKLYSIKNNRKSKIQLFLFNNLVGVQKNDERDGKILNDPL